MAYTKQVKPTASYTKTARPLGSASVARFGTAKFGQAQFGRTDDYTKTAKPSGSYTKVARP